MDFEELEIKFAREPERYLADLVKLSEQSHPKAIYTLGMAYMDCEGVGYDLNKCFELLQKSSDLGCLNATHDLACFLTYYEENAIDHERAILLFNKAIKFNYIPSILFLGCMYRDGDGILRNREQALALFKKAAELGSKDGEVYFNQLSNA